MSTTPRHRESAVKKCFILMFFVVQVYQVRKEKNPEQNNLVKQTNIKKKTQHLIVLNGSPGTGVSEHHRECPDEVYEATLLSTVFTVNDRFPVDG